MTAAEGASLSNRVVERGVRPLSAFRGEDDLLPGQRMLFQSRHSPNSFPVRSSRDGR